ncbi:MAG TPA: DUF177 domain-containing protein [Acidimicrobiales bacterium]|nr:DUF177 domain-containing protein [Acidimicrobiales bacterium]
MRTSPFLVHVGRILRTREPGKAHAVAPLDDLFVSGSEVPAGSDVSVEVALEPVGRSIEAAGTVSAPWTGACRRCLRQTAGVLVASVREVFEPDPVEGESYPLAHDQIDLEPLAREAVMLELPPAPLCDEGCRGLCAHCGIDLNEEACGCEAPADPRWAALDQLRTEN